MTEVGRGSPRRGERLSRRAVNLLTAFVMGFLLTTPIRPVDPRSEMAPPSEEPSTPSGSYRATGQTLSASPLIAAQDEDPVRPRPSTELVPKTDPKDIAAPGHDTVPTPQTKASIPGPAVFSATRALPPVASTPNGASYFVKIGPVSEGNAAEIVRQLRAAHYPPKMEDAQTEPQRFRVVSGPMPRGAAEQLVASLTQNGFPSLTRSLPEDRVEVQFGVFSAQGYAEDLADRIHGRGYTPAVVREAGVPIITVGPYSEASVKAILTLIESTMADHSLTTVPCGSKDPLNRAWRGWAQVCEASSDGPR